MPNIDHYFHCSLCLIGCSFLITLAGFPATIVYGGTSFLTTEPVETIEFSPIVTPGRMTTFKVIHAPLLIWTGAILCEVGRSILRSGVVGLECVRRKNTTANEGSSSFVMR